MPVLSFNKKQEYRPILKIIQQMEKHELVLDLLTNICRLKLPVDYVFS